MHLLVCWCCRQTVQWVCVFGDLSGSHTHSEPRIVIIVSELLQTDGRTDRQDGWTDRCVTDRQGERGIRSATKRRTWSSGPKLNQVSEAGNKIITVELWEENRFNDLEIVMVSGLINQDGRQWRATGRMERGRTTCNRSRFQTHTETFSKTLSLLATVLSLTDTYNKACIFNHDHLSPLKTTIIHL